MVNSPAPIRVDCVGGIVTDGTGRLLLIRRGKEPSRGCWSVPGGRVESGETLEAATGRELLEETGLHVRVGALVGTVEREAPDGSTFVIYDFACTPIGPSRHVVAGDDADDVGWFTPEQLLTLDCAPGLVEALVEWGVLSSSS